jgi:hypothetical protein
MKSCLLVTETNKKVIPTSLAKVVAMPGAVTCDEYFHFLVQSFTSPHPAFAEWRLASGRPRYPLLFSVKYLLAKCAIGMSSPTQIDQLIAAYGLSEFIGDENQAEFVRLVTSSEISARGRAKDRQARESLQAISQISYFHLEDGNITLSLDREDAATIFDSLGPIEGVRSTNGNEEIARLADLFRDGSNQDFFGYPNTILAEVVESGFSEGSKVKRTHINIERNRELIKAFFQKHHSAICDVCSLDTHSTYPWTPWVLDVHHLLPLASGTRVVTSRNNKVSTTFDDLVAVCPSCHRAVHRFYDKWLDSHKQKDFTDKAEAADVYEAVKSTYAGAIYV